MKPLLAASVLTATLIAGAAHADTYAIDSSHSQAVFRLSHLGVGAFWGMFYKVEGTVVTEPSPSISLTIDGNSLFTADKKRDDHLKGPDFFNTKQFPALSFKSTEVKKAGAGYEVTGDLTIRGTTKKVTAKVEGVGVGKDPWGATRAGWEAKLTIKRSEFGMNFMPGGLGEEVQLILAVEGVKK